MLGQLRPVVLVVADMRPIGVLCAVAVCAAWSASAQAGTEGYGNVQDIDCAPHGPCAAVDDRNDVTVAVDPAARWAWTARTLDIYAPSVACTDAGMCVAAGSAVAGPTRAAVSRDAMTGAPTWSPALDTGLGGIVTDAACTSQGLCVLVGSKFYGGPGVAATTTDEAVWHAEQVSEAELSGLSCPADGLCVATDKAGRVWTTRDPGATAPHWASTQLGGNPLVAVSCPSTTLCVAISENGFVSRSTNPAGDDPQWATGAATVGSTLRALDCPSETLCLAVDATGRVYGSTAPAQDGGWAQVFAGLAADPADYLPISIACTAAPLCIVSKSYDIALSSDPTNPGAWRTDRNVFSDAIGTTEVSGKPRVLGTRVRISLTCTPPPMPGRCAGTARLRDRSTGKTWVRRNFNFRSVEPSLTLTLKLPAQIRRRLRRAGHLDATLQVTAGVQSLSVPARHEQVLRRRVRFSK